jgi:2-polyprenyl-3-methyl-5-hydroxy-6-metoxy-1,4-benzoquinol methylase
MCGNACHRIIFEEFGVDILQCRRCHHVFSSFEADPYYDGFWSDDVEDDEHFYWRKARGGMYREFIKRFLKNRSGRLLDMGCGLGFFVDMVGRVANWESYGCEISPVAVRYARRKLGLTNVLCSRLDNVSLPPGSFDVVTFWDVIDHLLYPDPVLRRCHDLLRPGGICFIRTPNIWNQLWRARVRKLLWGMQPTFSYLQARRHLHHYSMFTIQRLLERNGFGQVDFAHLCPVQTESTIVVRWAKTVAFDGIRTLAAVTNGYLNIDNLFAIARKRTNSGP